jgi:chromatin remodeling complex protein RSC6
MATARQKTGKTSGKPVPWRRASRTKQPRGGLAQKVEPDDKLAAVVGRGALPRSEVVRKFWRYVKTNNLQAPNDRRKINADDKLKPLFGGKKQMTMFDVSRVLAQHVH